MTPQTVEERLTAIELELQNLKQLVIVSPSGHTHTKPNWRLHVEGSMENEPLFDEMVRLGREWRQSESIEEYNARHSGEE